MIACYFTYFQIRMQSTKRFKGSLFCRIFFIIVLVKICCFTNFQPWSCVLELDSLTGLLPAIYFLIHPRGSCRQIAKLHRKLGFCFSQMGKTDTTNRVSFLKSHILLVDWKHFHGVSTNLKQFISLFIQNPHYIYEVTHLH